MRSSRAGEPRDSGATARDRTDDLSHAMELQKTYLADGKYFNFGRVPKNRLCRNTIRSWLPGEPGQRCRECARPPRRQVPRGASVDRGGTAPPCAASGGGYRWTVSLPIADAISGSPPVAHSACRFGCAEPRRPG